MGSHCLTALWPDPAPHLACMGRKNKPCMGEGTGCCHPTARPCCTPAPPWLYFPQPSPPPPIPPWLHVGVGTGGHHLAGPWPGPASPTSPLAWLCSPLALLHSLVLSFLHPLQHPLTVGWAQPGWAAMVVKKKSRARPVPVCLAEAS